MRGVYCPNCGSKVEIENRQGECTDPRCGADIEAYWKDNSLIVEYSRDTFELPPK